METKENKKVRGPKFTPPQEFRMPSNSTFASWSKSLQDQVSYRNTIMEEAGKSAAHHGYVPKIKITKRYKQAFDEAVVDSRRKAKHKKKRNN